MIRIKFIPPLDCVDGPSAPNVTSRSHATSPEYGRVAPPSKDTETGSGRTKSASKTRKLASDPWTQ